MKRLALPLLAFCFLCHPICAQTIAEKKASLLRGSADLDADTFRSLTKFNQELNDKKMLLRNLYAQAQALYELDGDTEQLKGIRDHISQVRKEIVTLEEEWQVIASESSESERYALWHQPETTLEELIIDYGAQDYVYIIPPKIAGIKLSVNSNIPIPRTAWNGMLESIVKQNGVGIRQINPYLRELYLIKEEPGVVTTITNSVEDLDILPSDERIAFLLSPNPQDVKRSFFFLEKFVNPNTTMLQQVGRDILIVGQVKDLQDLLKMYDFMAANRSSKEYKLVPLLRIKSEEMAKILTAMFDQIVEFTGKGKKSEKKGDEIETNGLKVVILEKMTQGLFLVGSKEEISKAENLIREIETQFAGAREKTIFWYTVKHSTAEDIATILQSVYSAMIREHIGEEEAKPTEIVKVVEPPREGPRVMTEIGRDAFYQEGSVAINPAPIGIVPEKKTDTSPKQLENMIIDPKTGSIIMVVERDLLPKLKEVIAKIDVPKKMVQIEVLLFEKRFNDRTFMGLNLLRMGGCASQTNFSCLQWNDIIPGAPGPGILEYFLSRAKNNGIPAFDLAYRFMISQDDIQINANPSVVTINQVPATIAILEELSINTGINFIETTGTATPRDSFTRAQYGTTLEITPTIHLSGEHDFANDALDYITLETNINFDTIQEATLATGRPVVTRRNIHNEVLIPDGQTIILGGLRCKDTQDSKEKIPYLGEIPGFGKFFSTTSLRDFSSEMFIFITPRIIKDPEDDLQKVKCEQMCRRPGDHPDFLCMLNEARKRERRQILSGTIKMLFGVCDRYYYPTKLGPCNEPCFSEYESRYRGEYDGR